jgi:hypothetical protein
LLFDVGGEDSTEEVAVETAATPVTAMTTRMLVKKTKKSLLREPSVELVAASVLGSSEGVGHGKAR